MAFFKSKRQYLEFEKDCVGVMDKYCKAVNRKKYNITKQDLIEFYGTIKDKTHNNRVKKEKFNKEQTVEQLHLFQKIFDGEDDAFIRLYNKNTGEYYSFPVKALLDESKLHNILNSNRFKNKLDLMYSLNTYNNMHNHSKNSIFTLNSFAIDLDYKDIARLCNKTPKQVLKILEKCVFGKSIPRPNIVEYGNNIRLIYVLEKSYSTKNVNTLVTRICKTIGERLADYGGKGQPITTFGRVVNSKNSKTNKTIKATYLDVKKYNISYLKDSVLAPLPDWYAEYKSKSKRKVSKVIRFTKDFNDRAKARKYNLNRIQDFFAIVDYFQGDVDSKRYMCFQVRNHAKLAGMSDKEAEDVMRQLNNKFKHPLKWRVIEQDTRNVNRKQYYYKSQTILDYISIDAEIEEVLELSALLSKTEKNRRHNISEKARQKAKYRNEEGLTNQEISRRNDFILWAKMELKGLSYKAIAKELGYTHHNRITRKINKIYDRINYIEILEEVKLGLYEDLQVVVG